MSREESALEAVRALIPDDHILYVPLVPPCGLIRCQGNILVVDALLVLQSEHIDP